MKKLIILLTTFIMTMGIGINAHAGEIVDTTVMYTYEAMVEDISLLCDKYDSITYRQIGESELGKPIYVIVMGNANAKHNVLINASIHACEYQNSQLMMDIIEHVAPTYNADVCYYIIPMDNPDGVYLAQNSGYKKWKANGAGVDLNRNFPVGFNSSTSKLKSDEPGSAYYAGPAPLSSKEAQAINLMLVERRYDCVINYHQQGQVIYYGQFNATKETGKKSHEIANVVNALNGYKVIADGAANGSLADYVNKTFDTPTVTIETGTKVPSPVSAYKTIYKQNKDIITALNNYLLKTP